MLRLARVKRSDVVYDLGCGDGRIVIAAAKLFGARAVGIDIDPALIRRAKANAKIAGVEHLVRFEQANFFDSNLREASVVTLFLLTEINLRLRPKLLRELEPGARIVSHTFDMGKLWKPDAITRPGPPNLDNPYLNPKIYLWIVPATAGQKRGGHG
jgi:SAM-dependent methyltransferase